VREIPIALELTSILSPQAGRGGVIQGLVSVRCKIRVYSCPLVVRESSKFLPALFGTDCGEQDQRQKNHERKKSERLRVIRMPTRVTKMIGQLRFYNGCVGGE